MAPKDRQIKLDPMEWRDAMKDVASAPAKKKPAKPSKSAKPTKAKGSKSR